VAALLLKWGLQMFFRARNDRGFSVIELMMVVLMLGTLAAIAVPVMTDMTASIKLNEAARIVEREMQDARLKAVSSNRVIRVRLNCPAAGYIRSVEVLGTAADNASNRCMTTAYPFPPPDDDIMTRPNFDGPVRVLPNSATVTNQVLQFSPDGTAAEVISGVSTTIATPVSITISRNSRSRTVTVNNVGKVQLLQ
jgi:prepilin-type N-terminal cleavage/methylation domain-containing protein